MQEIEHFRTTTLKFVQKSQFFVGALSFIILEYYIFIFQYMRFRLDASENSTIAIIFFFHIILILLLWSMYRSVTSDPGKVPLYWGVIMDDPETKKRRYCLICHQFKPERSHHCSTCERCVLNMDHHCPWIMNCIGFANRKFFILMVFYISVAVIYMIGFEIAFLIENRNQLSEIFSLSNLIFKGVWLIITILFASVIINFLTFHLQLLLHNSTTIETMERQKMIQNGQPVPATNPFDYGFKYNWCQVFGIRPILWLVPIFAQSGKPLGDGVTWDKLPLSYFTEENNPHIVYLEQMNDTQDQR